MSGGGDRGALCTTIRSSTSGSSSSSFSRSSPPRERRSGDFSISAILSEETGGGGSLSRRKARVGSVGGERRSLCGALSSVADSPTGPTVERTPIRMQQTEGVNLQLSTPSRFNPRLYSSPHLSSSHSTASPSTHNSSHWVGPLNQSVSLSPFNIGLLLPLSPSPTSCSVSRDRLIDLDLPSTRTGEEEEEGKRKRDDARLSSNDSLEMLSEVALYHGEVSGREGGKETCANATSLSVGDGMARMRLESSSDAVETTLGAEERHQTTPPHPPSPSHHHTITGRAKGRTPHILKRDRKRPRQLANSFPQDLTPHNPVAAKSTHALSQPLPSSSHGTDEAEPTTLDSGFLSPTSVHNKSPQHSNNLSFSPSIFLSRPVATNSSSSSNSCRRRKSSGGSGLSGEENNGHVTRTVVNRPADTGGRCDSESEGAGNGSHLDEGGTRGSASSTTCHPPSVQVSKFVTSTPIKRDKENSQSVGLQVSPTYLSPTESGSEVKRPRLRDASASETSSGSDSEFPPPVTKSRPRSQAVRRHYANKARAQLSPLLENSCSPIAKSDCQLRPPSSLLTANFPVSSTAAPPSLGSSVNTSTVPGGPPTTPTTPHPPPVSFSFLQSQVPAVPFPFSAASAPYLPRAHPSLYMGVMPVPVTTCNPVMPAPVTTCNPLFPVPLSPPHTPYFISPCAAPPQPLLQPQQLQPPAHLLQAAVANSTSGLLQPPSSFYYSSTPRPVYGGAGGYMGAPSLSAQQVQQQQQQSVVHNRWGSSPLSTQIERTGQIQSVPPWFIFEQNKPEGKRLRLTEAINRSLSETPSHNPKLPAGWTKYACGQTDDQKQLTQRARQFLQSGRRQLTFDNINT